MMKTDTEGSRACMLFAILVIFTCGCVTQEKTNPGQGTVPAIESTVQGQDTTTSVTEKNPATTQNPPAHTTSTVSQSPPVTSPLRSNLSVGKTCSANGQCMSGCCDSNKGAKKCQDASFCTVKSLGEIDCHQKGLYWCIDLCRKEACGACDTHVRCVTVTENGADVPKVETATEVAGREGSCKYSGDYTNAGGKDSYCDKFEGSQIYAKCGIEAGPEDCLKYYNENAIYWIVQGRSFHSPEGEEYDLYCFKCAKATG